MKRTLRTLAFAGIGGLAFLFGTGIQDCPEPEECYSPSDCGDYETCVDGQCVYVCEAEGGTVSTGLCCQSAGDFPNNCAVGACGCAPEYSHEVLTCTCPPGMCWDGAHCVEPPPGF